MKLCVLTAFGDNGQRHSREFDELRQQYQMDIDLHFNAHEAPTWARQDSHVNSAVPMLLKRIKELQATGQYDAILIESYGDTAIKEARLDKDTHIPMIGMLESTANKIRKINPKNYGMISAETWQGITLSKMFAGHDLKVDYIGYEAVNLPPFFAGIPEQEIESKILDAAKRLIDKNVDTIVLAGSYFFKRGEALGKQLKEFYQQEYTILDPFESAIECAKEIEKTIHEAKEKPSSSKRFI